MIVLVLLFVTALSFVLLDHALRIAPTAYAFQLVAVPHQQQHQNAVSSLLLSPGRRSRRRIRTPCSSLSSAPTAINGDLTHTDTDSSHNNSNGMSTSTSTSTMLPMSNSTNNLLVQASLNGMEGVETPGRVAVILNTNARAVTAKVKRIAKQVFAEENDSGGTVFVTTTAEEAQAAARQIVAEEGAYRVVVPVGGDGTLTSAIDYMVQALQQRQPPTGTPSLTVAQAIQKLPVIGYVPLGTGNGVGSVVGCTLNKRIRRSKQLRHVLESLKRVAATTTPDRLGSAPRMETSIVELPMMQVSTNCTTSDMTTTRSASAITSDTATASTGTSNGNTESSDLCFFAGVGFDSLMLNDYKDIKAWSKKTGFLPTFLSSVAGYCVALVVKTLPSSLLYRKHNIQVTVTTPNDPAETLWVDHRRGDFVQKCHSPVLFEGTTGILAAGTAPFYGGGLRLFPFARLTVDKMHLRLGRISPMTGFVNIPRIFSGSYRDTTDRMGVLDFMGREFDVTVRGTDGRGFPLQHSGESVGDVEQFRLRVVDEPVRFLSFLPKRK